MKKKWQIKPQAPIEFFRKFSNLSPIVAQLLYNRGLTQEEEILKFLKPSWNDLLDPFLFPQMERAVKRIRQAINNKERILIHGDYDADGVCAAVILFETLKRLGAKFVEVYLPDRISEGYGLKLKTVETYSKKGTNLFITVDCGIADYEAISQARKAGQDVIVVDHHHPPQKLPPAFAIIHPALKGKKSRQLSGIVDNYFSSFEDKYLSAGGVVFKLCQALLGKREEAFLKWLLDLVAISTVADVMPILGENRILVKYGLIVLNKTRRLGLKELIKTARLSNSQANLPGEYKLDVANISWQIAPRLNAAGRMKHAKLAYELLVSQDYRLAESLAKKLQRANQDRQLITQEILALAHGQVQETERDQSIIILGDNWSPSLVGLVAGRLAEEYYRPTLVLTRQAGDLVIGSGRSIPEFNLLAALERADSCLDHYGGHPSACGFTLTERRVNEFVYIFKETARRLLKDKELQPKLDVDLLVSFAELSDALIETIDTLKPFGEGNPEPLFLSDKVKVENFSLVGINDKKHLKLKLSQAGTLKTALVFNWQKLIDSPPPPGSQISLVYNLMSNFWNGEREIQLKVKDLRF